MQILETQPAGAFIVRDSSSHKNCFALSLNTGDDIGHFLIERGEDDDTLHFSVSETFICARHEEMSWKYAILIAANWKETFLLHWVISIFRHHYCEFS